MSDTGGGHRSLSRAIATAVEARGGAATIFDPVAGARSPLPSRILGLYGPLIRALPPLYGAVFDVLDSPGRFAAIARRLGATVVDRLADAIDRERPDVLVVAHALTTTLALDAVERTARTGGRRLPLAAMVTELATVHWSWIDRRVDRYFAATDEVVRSLEEHGVGANRITRTGLPVGRGFGSLDVDPVELRQRLRLVAGATTALVLAGGEGSGRLAELVPRLSAAVPELQIVVVCGRNEPLRARLSGCGLSPSVRVLGFVDNMAELMQVADFVLTKGGPQTLAETLAAGRPAVVTDLLPGQERGNGAYVVRRGAGYLALTVPDVLAAARRLVADEAERARLAANARAIGPRRAADHVVDALRQIAEGPPPWLRQGVPAGA